MEKTSLLKKLIQYKNKMIPFHMPGHKRVFNKNSLIPYCIDITEVHGFDNLHDMNGILKDTATLAKNLYNSIYSFPLVNGSTCGILAGIYALTRENKSVLIARNCHKSVYNAAEILDLDAHYIMPPTNKYGVFDAVSPSDVEKSIKENNIGLVVITSPTYEGIVCDVSSIYEICKKHGAFLLVDCAHGAHIDFLDSSKSPVSCSDICVMSLHKTLPSLTQTALLNVCSYEVDKELVRHALSIFETSSPSYVLLSSIDECLRYLNYSKNDFNTFIKNIKKFYSETASLKNIKVFHFDDLSKIVIASDDGFSLCEMLRQEKIEVEMATSEYVLAIATVSDTKKSLTALKNALFKIDKKIPCLSAKATEFPKIPEKICSVSKALKENGEFLDLNQCEGKLSLEYVWAYPPGAPLIVPGEIISRNMIEYLNSKKDLKSTKGKFPKIYVK